MTTEPKDALEALGRIETRLLEAVDVECNADIKREILSDLATLRALRERLAKPEPEVIVTAAQKVMKAIANSTSMEAEIEEMSLRIGFLEGENAELRAQRDAYRERDERFAAAVKERVEASREANAGALAALHKQPTQDFRIGQAQSSQGAEPVAFIPYTEKELREWHPVMCNGCGWHGLSRDCAGGGAIADTGDYADLVCPKCVNWESGPVVAVTEVVTLERPTPPADVVRDAPEGFVLVPSEPTSEMVLAGVSEAEKHSPKPNVYRVYCAMLAASREGKPANAREAALQHDAHHPFKR